MSIINSVIKGKQPVIDTLNVTPTTSAQQITAPSGTDGYSPVNVSAVTSSIDANIVAGNIKKDVQILGVTGSYEGTTPTGTVNITSNGTHNVSSYEYAEVLVPTTAPAYYIEKTKDANNVAQNGSHLMDFSTFTDVGAGVFSYAYYQNTNITGTVDLSGLNTITGDSAFQYCFSGCTGITGADLSNLTTISGAAAFIYAFYNCTGITNINLSKFTNVSSSNGALCMFANCTGLTSVSLPSLIQLDGCAEMFRGCTNLTSVSVPSVIKVYANGSNSFCSGCTALTNISLSSMVWVNANNALSYAFYGCTGLTTFDFTHLCRVGSSMCFGTTFRNCTSLTSLSFPNLAYTATNFNGAFNNTLQGVTGCTVHFPAEWQTMMSSWSNITNGMGGTNTTILFDLPNVTTLDLSHIKSIEYQGLLATIGANNYFRNITGVNLSGLEKITTTQSLTNAFNGTASITSVDLSSLTTINGYQTCSSAFNDCTGLVNVNLSSLKEMLAGLELNFTFGGCTSLTELKFPALKNILSPTCFRNMLRNTSNVTVHFPSNMSTAGITASEISGTNTTILYDLPATNILTGADTKEYERNPKYDTATALAWRINGTMPNTTTYYTSGLTDPTVGTTIYSDSACTIAETTVDSIA